VVLSFDAATGLKQAFVNGVLVDSKLTPPAPLAANTSPLVINNPATSACTSGNGHFDGAMDDLRLYNRSLSQAEVAELFAPIALSPRQISLTPLGTTAFQAALSGSQTAPLTWGTSGGSITPDGAYTAPTQPGLYTVTASAALAPSKPGVAMVYVRDYDASEEFSISQNPAGTWSYGWSTSLGGGFTPFSTPQVAPTGVAYWTASGIGSLGIYYNGTDRVVTPYGSTNYLPNQLAMHPGPSGQYSLLRWTAPESGSFDIRAAFKALDPQPATTDVHVLLNGISKFDGMVNSVLTGPVYTGTLAVQAGDKVDIAVGYGNGYYGYDSTAVSVRINRVVPTVVVTPGHVLLAPAATKAFQATVAGLPSTGVVWTVEEGSIGGSISSEGLYTAPAAPGVFHVVATSAADGSVLGKATVVVE
jgi:hypothetical protein